MMSCGHGDAVIFILLCAAVCYVKLSEYNMSNICDAENVHQKSRVRDDQTMISSMH